MTRKTPSPESKAKHKEYHARWRAAHRDRYKQYRANYEKKNPGAVRDAQLKYRWGLTPEEYEARLLAQGGVCAVCGDPPTPERRLHVDHDHATGKLRKLLCMKCNRGIGYLNDSPELLRKALAYLEEQSSPQE